MSPYIGPDLPHLFSEAPAQRAAKNMAQTGQSALQRLVRENTPIDTGALRESWYKEPIIAHGGLVGVITDAYEGSVISDLDYAVFVEEGTGLWGPEHRKYLILPKKPGGVLHWVDKLGKDHFARKVLHPGSPGQHMMASALAKLEVVWPELMLADLERWKYETEALFAEAQVGVAV